MIRKVLLGVLFLLMLNSAVLHAQTPTSAPSANSAQALESLAKSHHVTWPFNIVIYTYKNESGKWVMNETTYKKLPPELQNKDWICWVDSNGVENCRATN